MIIPIGSLNYFTFFQGPSNSAKALERAARKREREEAEAGEPDAAAVEKVTRQRRMKQVDITEDDAPVMKTMAKFPMHRRIAVLHLDDGDAGMHRCIANGDPFILRPKKGKSFLKSVASSHD